MRLSLTHKGQHYRYFRRRDSTSAKKIVFRVYDSGLGATIQDFEKLTQRFYREDSSRSKSGNGLGLALVLAIVNLHQGTIKFIDNPLGATSGLGCEITFPKS